MCWPSPTLRPTGCIALSIAFLTLSACNWRPAETAFTAEDLRAARQAMPISEVSLMLRSGYKQQGIIAEVERRHIAAKINAPIEQSVVRSGATPALIRALKSDANILTATEKAAYDNMQKERVARQNEANPQQLEQESEQQRKQASLQQAMNKLATSESKEDAYWRGDKEYRTKKTSLENRIVAQQACVNRLRSQGYHESELVVANQRLDQYKDELAHLQEPLR